MTKCHTVIRPFRNYDLPRESKSTGAPGRTRTCDPRLRRPVLYPTELRAHGLQSTSPCGAPLLPSVAAPTGNPALRKSKIGVP